MEKPHRGRGLRHSLTSFGLAAIGLAGVAWAGDQFLHQGSTDPLTEGWTYWTITGGIDDGPVTDDLGEGISAWYWDSTSLGQEEGFRTFLTTAQQALADAEGWRFAASIRMATLPGAATPVAPMIHRPAAGYSWELLLFSNDGISLVGRMNSSPPDATPSSEGIARNFSVGGDAFAYHDYEIRFDADEGSADLYIDGTVALEDVYPRRFSTNEERQVMWGGFGPSICRAHFSSVAFEIAPPPLFPGARVANGILKDSDKNRKDSIRINGRVDPPPGEALLDPLTEDLALSFGPVDSPFEITIPAGDRGWKSSRNQLSWRSTKGKEGKIQVKFNLKTGKYQVKAYLFDWEAPPANPVGFTITTPRWTATDEDEWREIGSSQLKFP